MYAITEPNALSVVVAIVLVNFSHFHLLQNLWVNFKETWYKAYQAAGKSSLFK